MEKEINGQEDQELETDSEQPSTEPAVEEDADNQKDDSLKEEEKPQTFTVNGQEVTLEELQKGYLRQDDYTRKAQDLAEQRRLIDRLGQQGQQQPQQQQPNATRLTAQQMEARDMLRQMGVVFNDDVKPTQQEISVLKEKFEDQAVDKEMTDLKSEFHLDASQSREVLKFAADNGLPSLKLAYKAMVYDKKIDEAKAQGQKEAAKELKQRKAAMIESGKTNTQNTKDGLFKKGMSWEDVLDKGKTMLGLEE